MMPTQSPDPLIGPAHNHRTSVLILAVALLLILPRPASAYTDPGTGALIWQMLAAGFVGLLFYTRRFTSWFRSKKKEPKP